MKRIKHIVTITAIALAAAGTAHAQATAPVEQAVGITQVTAPLIRTECRAATGGGWFGPALGAILGGGAGSQVGKGSGQAAAAAIGATLGAQAGGAVAGNSNGGQTCREIHESEMVGYSIRTSAGRDVFVPLVLIQQFNGRSH